jgi:glycerophosphoryl diester phosphodiesterase
MNAFKKKISITVVLLIIVFYMILTVIPNLFVKKGIDISTSKNVQIVAHRGGAGTGLENTLTCIEKGIIAGADAIEVDVHLTKDGYLLICHDETVDRTTNGSGKIREMNLDEIQKLHVTDKNGQMTEEHLPTLEEVLLLVNGRTKLLVEVKRTHNIYEGIEKKLLDEINRLNVSSWVIIQSFNDSVLENIHQLNPGQRLEKLIIFKFPGLPVIFDGTFTKFSFEKYAYISSFNIFHYSASRSLIDNIHKQGKEVKIWTLDKPETTPDLPVDGIITDRPDLFQPE